MVNEIPEEFNVLSFACPSQSIDTAHNNHLHEYEKTTNYPYPGDQIMYKNEPKYSNQPRTKANGTRLNTSNNVFKYRILGKEFDDDKSTNEAIVSSPRLNP